MFFRRRSSKSRSIFSLIENEQWYEVKRRCEHKESKESQQVNEAGWLPIHSACYKNAPIDVIEVLYQSYPDGAKQQSYAGWLPVHIAITGGAQAEVVGFLYSITDRKQGKPFGWKNMPKSMRRSSITEAA